ncbi:hypothetical protein [Hymenobacter fastidiosus]
MKASLLLCGVLLLALFSRSATAQSGNGQPVARADKVSPASAPPMVRYITGKVLNLDGRPLAGATVTVGLLSGKSQTGIANSHGEVLVQTTEPALTAAVSYAGYQAEQQKLEGAQPFRFALKAIPGYRKDLKKRSKAAVKAFRKG